MSTLAGSEQGFNNGMGIMAFINHPNEMAIDENGVLYVADVYNYRILKMVLE